VFARSRTIAAKLFGHAFAGAAERRQICSAMSYRIQVRPEADSLLCTLAPHVVLRLGRALADLAESLACGDEAESSELRVDNCVMQFVVDHAHRLLEVIHVEQRETVVPSYAAQPATS
jgi:hypothetical protein